MCADFKVNDSLSLRAYSGPNGGDEFLENEQVLDRLDVNNDGWLGVGDMEVYDAQGDRITVHVGTNSMTLHVFDTEIVMHGMTMVPLDYLF